MPIAPSDVLSCWLLDDRNDYQTCHVRLPDGESLSAIALNNIYYGFRRRLMSSGQALKVLRSLSNPNSMTQIRDVALTMTPKGYFLWAREENALPKGKLMPKPPISHRPALFLHLPEFYQMNNIRVPDLDQVLVAVEFNGSYYSVFKVEPDPEEVLSIVKKLGQRGDEILVATKGEETHVCILEPGAALA